MKKTSILLAAALMVLGFSSCDKQKDGVYNPAQKIIKVETSYTSHYNDPTWGDDYSYTSSQEWVWDDDQLSCIIYKYQNGTENYRENFTYDEKGRITSSTTTDGNRIVYTYDGKLLASAQAYEDNELMASMTFEHDGKIMSRVTMNIEVDDDIEWKAERSSLRLVLDEQVCRSIDLCLAQARKSGAKNTMTVTIDYTWDGKNISEAKLSVMFFTSSIAYTYDNMKNPLRGILNMEAVIEDGGLCTYSQNNVLTCSSTGLMGEGAYSVSYQYTYEDKFPTTCTSSESHEDGTYTTTVRYTYAK